jgi:hypothetical protein
MGQEEIATPFDRIILIARELRTPAVALQMEEDIAQCHSLPVIGRRRGKKRTGSIACPSSSPQAIPSPVVPTFRYDIPPVVTITAS